MRRTPLARRTPLRRGAPLPSRGRIKPMSDKRKAENRERRRVLHATYGTHPRCALCEPLRDRGVVTGCNGWADDGDEIRRRSAGGSITDPANVRPVGRPCHRWVTEHPALAREWGLVESRYGRGAA
jgi:hypothetical protein